MSKRKYASSVARRAGNIASGLVDKLTFMQDDPATAIKVDVRAIAFTSVALARAIVAEVQRTEPVVAPECGENIAGTKLFCSRTLDHVGPCGR